MKYALLLLPLALIGCTQPDKVKSILEAQGLSSVEITGWNALACSEDDVFSTGFEATSVTGNKVRGTVCSGFLKGSTVRYQ